MNAIFRLLVCGLVGAAAVSAAPSTSRVVVLDNENLLEGEVVRVDDGYEIRQPGGSALTIPAKRVVAVVADRKAAFAVVAERSNRSDADERLRLAHWCAASGLSAEALSEARAAARMRPGFAAAERYAALLEETASRKPASSDPAVLPAKAESSKPDTVTDVPAVEYNSESLPLFVSRINTILVNTCANCHARDDVKAFRLTRVTGRSGATKNMIAALPYVNAKEPESSAILTKALTAHGAATEAPFKVRTHPAYQALEFWARIARAPEGTTSPEPTPLLEPRKLPDLERPETTKSSGESFGQDSKSVRSKPTKNETSDPFDPAIFNGEVKKK